MKRQDKTSLQAEDQVFYETEMHSRLTHQHLHDHSLSRQAKPKSRVQLMEERRLMQNRNSYSGSNPTPSEKAEQSKQVCSKCQVAKHLIPIIAIAAAVILTFLTLMTFWES